MSIAVSYHNLGGYLRHARQPASALACHLGAALIRALAGADGTERSAGAAANDLRAFGADAVVPADVTGLCRQVGDIPGADLDRLLATLAPDPDALEQLFQELVATVREAASLEQE